MIALAGMDMHALPWFVLLARARAGFIFERACFASFKRRARARAVALTAVGSLSACLH